MEVIFHLIFQVFKIAVLSLVYSFLVISFLWILEKFYSNDFLKRVKLAKKNYWFLYGFYISVALFVFSFSYWGNHGLGDGPKIPIGNWETIENINWTEYAYIEGFKSEDGNSIEMNKFKVENGKLCGNLKSWFYDYKNDFFVLDLNTDKIIEFKTETDYNKHATENKLPLSKNLLSFHENYREFWGGARFWLLP